MKKKTSNAYFTEDTEKAIIEYNNSSDPIFKERIFTDKIYTPFYKLAENIIHTFKFHYTSLDTIEDLKHEIVTILLVEKISKFDPSRGAKAYSYFGTIVKRWLIHNNTKNFKKLKVTGTLDELDELYEDDPDLYLDSPIDLSKFLDLYVNYMYSRLEDLFIKKMDFKIADAILTIFKTRQDLDIFKKKALYIYIREMTDCDTASLTRVINILKLEFYDMYNKYIDLGKIEI